MQTRSIIFAGAAALLVMSAAAPASADSAPTTPMSLGDAVAYALNHSPTIAQKYAAVGSAYNVLGQARINAFPEVIGQLQNTSTKLSNYNLYGNLDVPGASSAQEFSQNVAEIGVPNYTLKTGGLSFIQLAADKAQLSSAQQDLANAEDQIALTVTNAYYTVVQKQAIVTVDLSSLDYNNKLVGDAQVQEKAGVKAGVDVLKAQVQQAKSNSDLVGAQNDVTNASETLAQTIGAPLETTFAYAPEIGTPALPSQPLSQLETIALANRPDVASAQDSLAAARLTRTGWDRELAPTVSLTALFGNQLIPTSPNYEFTSTGAVATGPNGQPLIGPRGTPGFWQLSATSTFGLPLSDYGQRRFERVSDDAAVANAKSVLEQATTQVRIDVRQSYRAAQTALVQLGYARDETRLAVESARIERLQYQHGLVALSDVIQTQNQSVSAQSDLINAQVSYVEDVVKLRVSLGTFDARHAVADLR